MKCALCGHENPSTARVCGACTAVLRAAPDVAPGDPAPGQGRFLPARDTLRRRAEAQGDPELFPPSVLQLYEGGDPLGAFLRPRLSRMGYEIAQLVDTNFIVAAVSSRIGLGAGLPVSEAHTNQFAELFASGSPVIATAEW